MSLYAGYFGAGFGVDPEGTKTFTKEYSRANNDPAENKGGTYETARIKVELIVDTSGCKKIEEEPCCTGKVKLTFKWNVTYLSVNQIK